MGTDGSFSTQDIDDWSRRGSAPLRLPDLIRRLLLATAPLGMIEMRADEGVRFEGADGIVRASAETAFCPEGLSVWELTVDSAVEKRDEDYAKRTSTPPPGVDPATSCYVAVVARAVKTKKAAWVERKRRERRWRDVRLLDADDLATWLTGAPAVACWFAAELGCPAFDRKSLDALLEGWRVRTTPPFPLEVMVAGDERSRGADRVREWAWSPQGVPLHVRAPSRDEALTFVAAALALDRDNAAFWHARTIVVESETALRWAQRSAIDDGPLVVLPDFESFRPELVDPPTGRARVVIPLSEAHAVAQDELRLEPAGHRLVAEALERAGFAQDEVRRRAEEAGGSVFALQRLYGFVPKPTWATESDPEMLAAMLLIGAWNPKREADREVVRQLGVDPARFEAAWEDLSRRASSPVAYDHDRWGRGGWSWTALGDAWHALSPRLPRPHLSAFASMVLSVLGKDDPRYELAPDARFSAPVAGKVLPESEPLREGLASSLARLAEHDDALAPRHGPSAGSRLADQVVNALLEPTWVRWASLSDLLPMLAEAAPRAFLDRLRQSLDAGDQGAARLLAEEGQFSSPHTGLLWALETLGWHERWLPDVVRTLGDLAAADRKLPDRPGRLANRPASSLAHIVDLTFAQTAASSQTREALLRQLAAAQPQFAFDLVVGQFPKAIGSFITGSRRPRVRSWSVPTEDDLVARAKRDAAAGLSRTVAMALDLAGVEAKRWKALLDASYSLPPHAVQLILDTLDERREDIADPELLMWSALRRWLKWDNRRGPAPATSPLHCRRRALYEALTPDDLVARIAWLFHKPWVDLPEHTQGVAEAEARQEALRVEALNELWAQADHLTQLASLAESANPALLGSLLAKVAFANELEPVLLDADAATPLRKLVPSFVAFRAEARSADWVTSTLSRLIQEGRHEDAVAAALWLPRSGRWWDAFERLGEPFRISYWRELSGYMTLDDPAEWERAVRSFLDSGNTQAALVSSSSGHRELATATILSVLEAFGSDDRALTKAASQDPVMTQHHVETLFNALDARSEVGVRDLANLELKFLPFLAETARGLRKVGLVLGEEPDEFAALVVSSASNAATRQVIEAWVGYPGEGLEMAEREERALAWAKRVVTVAASQGHEHAAGVIVAEVLARMPPGEDGHWPSLAARRWLEESSTPDDFARCLYIARYNARGGTSRDPTEGGGQERGLAVQFRDSARALRIDWPRASALLDELARVYEREGADHDAKARQTARRWGIERDEAGAILRRLRDYDVATALWLAARLDWGERLPELALRIGVQEGEPRRSLLRLEAEGLFEPEGKRIIVPKLLSVLRAGVRTAFPEAGDMRNGLTRGVLTGVDATFIRERLLAHSSEPLVWPLESGSSRGRGVTPLCPGAPALATTDPEMYELLALVDVLRFGRARERALAIEELRKRLLPLLNSRTGST